MFRSHSRAFWVLVIVIVAAIVFYLPSLVAYRYTATSQSRSFLTHPWRSWAFIYTALTVPGDSQLKTSGQALRSAISLFNGSSVDPDRVRLLFLPKGKAYTFTHDVGSRAVTTTVTPPYRFVWQVSGRLDTLDPDTPVIVALLDYASGHVLYDVRHDMPPGTDVPEATTSPSPMEPTPMGEPSPSP
jgi:hypothetical protein